MMRGLRLRLLVDCNGQKLKLLIRRLYCPKCRRIHHELPDCIVPYKRYCAGIIEEIISGKKQRVVYDYKTISRMLSWWNAVLPYFQNIIKSLAEKYKSGFDEPPTFKEIVRAAANTNNWIFANLICTRSAALSRQPAC